MQQLSLKWPIVITASVAAVEVLVYNNMTTPLRPIITIWFLLVCPGMAFVHMLRLHDVVSEFVLAVALSLVMALLVAGTILYLGWWSPKLILMLLLALSIVGVCCQLYLWLRERTNANVEQVQSTATRSTGTLA